MFRILHSIFPQGSFGQNVLVLTSGTVAAQVILVAASPVLTRIYTPEDFGMLAVFVAMLSLCVVVSSLRYEMAIPLPEEDDTAANLVVLSLFIASSMLVIVTIIIYTFRIPILRCVNASELRQYIWLFPLSLAGASGYQIFNYWAVRCKSFRTIAQTKLIQSVTQIITQLSLGVAGFTPSGLLIGDVVGRASGTGALVTLSLRQKYRDFKNISCRSLKEAALRYRRFPLYSSWSSLLNSASFRLPILLMASLFDGSVAGWFAFSCQVLQTPMTLIGQSIAQVFFSRASEAHQQGSVARPTWQAYEQLVFIGMAPFFLMSLAAPEVFNVVFGDKWEMAGIYIQWLSPWLFLVFLTSPLSSLVYVLEKQRIELLFQGGLLGFRLLAVLLGAYWHSSLAAIALFGVSNAFLWLIYMIWLLRISGNTVSRAAKLVLRESGKVLLVVCPVIAVKISHGKILVMLGAVILSGLLILYRCYIRLKSFSNEKHGILPDQALR